jgi:hypothetical protein
MDKSQNKQHFTEYRFGCHGQSVNPVKSDHNGHNGGQAGKKGSTNGFHGVSPD